MTSTCTPVAPTAVFDPIETLRSDRARDAFGALGDALRRGGYGNGAGGVEALERLALVMPVEVDELERHLDRRHLEALADVGAAGFVDDGRAVQLLFGVFSYHGVLATVPIVHSASDVVYLGPDSLVLHARAWRHGLGGTRAVDLGTGTGLLAMLLTKRYASVVATDIDPRSTATAELTCLLNEADIARRVQVSAHDVARGLRRGSFDLVTANAPWVPSPNEQNPRAPRVFADGGRTGFELPRRFILEAADLLAPAGVAIVLCVDFELCDGYRPLTELLEDLAERGYECATEATPLENPFGRAGEKMQADNPDIVAHAEHVAVIVRRT